MGFKDDHVVRLTFVCIIILHFLHFYKDKNSVFICLCKNKFLTPLNVKKFHFLTKKMFELIIGSSGCGKTTLFI